MLGNYGIIRWHLDRQGLLPDRFKENPQPTPDGEWVEWTQPVLTSNISYGKVTASSLATDYTTKPYYALNGKTANSTGENGYDQWSAKAGDTDAWWCWELPHEIKISKIEFYNKYSTGTNLTKTAQFFADKEMTIPIGEEFTCPKDYQVMTVIDVVEPVVTDTIFCKIYSTYDDSRFMPGIGELKITAECHASDVEVPEEPTLPEGKVWRAWDQPIFTSNDTWGLVTASHTDNGEPYAALDRKFANWEAYSNAWNVSGDSTSGWWKWQFKENLRVSSIKIAQRAYAGSQYTTTATVKTLDETEVLFEASIPKATNGFADLVFDEPRILDGITIFIEGTKYCGIGEILLDAEFIADDDTTEPSPGDGWVNWTQPVFDSDTTWGYVIADYDMSSSGVEAYHALNGTYYQGWNTNTSRETAVWTWKFQEYLKVSNIRIYQRYVGAAPYNYNTSSFSVKDLNGNQIGSEASYSVGPMTGAYVDVTLDDPKVLDGIVIECKGTTACGIGEVKLTAQHNIDATEFPEFASPKFRSGTTWGEVTASAFSDWNYAPYMALNQVWGNESTAKSSWVLAGNTSVGWWKWKFKENLKVSSIRVYQKFTSGNQYTKEVRVLTLDQERQWFEPQAMALEVNNYVDFVFDEPKILDGFVLAISGTGGCGLGEVVIDAEYTRPDSVAEYPEDSLYEEEWWEQPALTSNTSYGEVTASTTTTYYEAQPYLALDGRIANAAGENGGYNQWSADSSNHSNHYWWNWKLPHKIAVYELEFYNKYSTGTNTTSEAEFFGDTSYSIPLGGKFAANADHTVPTVVTLPAPVVIDTLRCRLYVSNGANMPGIGEIKIKAKLLKGE